MKGKELAAMMKGPVSAEPSSEEGYGAGSVREEADMAAKEFAKNPTAETFRALKTLCEELEMAEGYEDSEME